MPSSANRRSMNSQNKHTLHRQLRLATTGLMVIILVLGALSVAPSRSVEAQSSSLPAEINKSFLPISIIAGQTSRLSVTIFNPNAFSLINSGWTDTLPAGILLANPVNATTSCGGSVTAIAGGNSIVLSGGTVPAQAGPTPGSCTVEVNVTSTTPGNLINTIPAGGLTSTSPTGVPVTNTTPASATLQVGAVQPPSLNKNFSPNTIWAGDVSTLTINLVNNDLINTLSEVALTDSLPAGLSLANPVTPTLTNCGSASLTAVSGTGTISLTNATIAPNTTCVIKVRVTGSSQGTYTNTIPANAIQTRQKVTNAAAASANLAVQSIGLLKDFLAASIPQGGSTSLTITLRNPSGVAYTGVHLTDTLPGTLTIAASPAPVNNCGGTLTAAAGTQLIELTGGTVPASINPPALSTCTIVVYVTAPVNAPASTLTNTIPAGNMTTLEGISNPTAASDTLGVVAALTVSKSFSPASITAGSPSTVTITLRNYTAAPLTGVSFTDSLPAGLTVVGTPATPQCAGTVTSTANSVTLTGGTIPSSANPPTTNGSCTITFQVTSATSGSFTNTLPTGSVTANVGYRNITAASTSVSVSNTALPVNSSKSFSPTTITAGSNTRLRITVTAPADSDLSNVSITDLLPLGMTVSNSTAASITNCGASRVLTAPTGATTISLTNGTIVAGQTCQIDVYVTSSTPGAAVNTIPAANITYNESRPLNSTPSATLTVTSLTMSKAFYPPTVNPNGLSRLTITLTNNVTSRLVNVSLTDSLTTMGGTAPGSGVFIAAVPNAVTTCGGTLTAAAGTQLISLTSGIIPAKVGSVAGLCTISVDVQGRGTQTTRTNTIPVVNVFGTVEGTSTTINPSTNATAPLTIGNLHIVVNKAFNPLTVFGGSASTMSIELRNPDSAPLTGITFTDVMPTGMIVANPPNFNTGTCGGSFTGVAGDSSIQFSGGSLPAATTCTVTLSVTMLSNGNLTNSIPVGAVTTFNAVSNTQSADASLTNLPGASVSKYFSPSSIPAGLDQYSLLTITIRNTSTFSLTGLGLIDTLPAGLMIAGAPAPSPVNNCDGTLTAAVGTQLIQLSGGTLPGNGTCTMVIPVNGTLPGSFTNTIAPGSLTNNEGATNTLPATDTLTLTAHPSLNVTKTSTYSGPIASGSILTYDIKVENTGNVQLTNVSVTDPGVNAVLGSCLPAQPATLAPGASMTCTASHVVTLADMNLGTYSNTAIADSNETGEDSDTATVTIAQTPELTLAKSSTTTSYSKVGDLISYTFKLTNSGNVTLFAPFAVSDSLTTDEACPATPSSLAPSESLTCTATYTITQTDLDAGSVFNSASATAKDPAGSTTTSNTDTVTVNATQTPALSIAKSLTATGPFKLADELTYDIVVTNTGNMTLTGLTVSDPSATLGTCSPAQPATLAPGAVMTCPASHTVTQADVDAGSYANTATADSDQTQPSSDGETVTITQTPALSIAKSLTATGPFKLADELTYDIVVTNTGNMTLTGLTVSDPSATLGTCSPAQPATLAPGAVMTCPASHTVTQADVDAGSYANTATADSDQTQPSSDLKTVDILPNPTLPKTGFHPGVVSVLPAQPAALNYSKQEMRLQIPRLGLDLPVVGVPQSGAGWDVTWLGNNAGWLNGTAYPTWKGNSVLTGHVWDALNNPGPFVKVKNLKFGDQIRINAFGQYYIYEVRENRLVLPDQTSDVIKHEDKSWLTLLTCENFDETIDSYANRRMVRAVLVRVEPEK